MGALLCANSTSLGLIIFVHLRDLREMMFCLEPILQQRTVQAH